jgi:hypothetical protein
MTWYQWGGFWVLGWMLWGALGSIRDQLGRIANALGEPKLGSSFYGGGGLSDIAKAIRERRP